MGVRVRPHRKGKWMVRISYTTPDGAHHRDRKVPEGITSRTAAERWGHERLALLLGGKGEAKAIVPTLAEFWPRYMEGYVKANRQKHSEVLSKDSIYRNHLGPTFGARRLDTLSDEDVQALKARLAENAPSTVNNVLGVLRKALRVAVDWSKSTGLVTMPTKAEGVKVPKKEMQFYERDVLERLVVAAREVDDRAELVVLLGAEAGLRSGEMVGLTWADIDPVERRLTVNRTVYRGVVGPPKGGRSRVVPLSTRLAAALARARTGWHRDIPCLAVKVVSRWEWTRADPWQLRDWLGRAQRIAGISTGEAEERSDRPGKKRARQVGKDGRLHILRHTYGTHLVASGVNVLEVQRLMGHTSLKTTEKYLHAVKGGGSEAVRALEIYRSNSGNVAATAPSGPKKLRRIG